jgi:hypothetical protein
LWSIDEGVELRGGRASRRGSMAPLGERGWRTWRGRRIREAVARASTRVGEGRGKGIRSRWFGSASWLLDGLGRKAEQADRAAGPTRSELKRTSFQNKNWIFEFTKASEICTRRFGRNLDTRIFPKFF